RAPCVGSRGLLRAHGDRLEAGSRPDSGGSHLERLSPLSTAWFRSGPPARRSGCAGMPGLPMWARERGQARFAHVGSGAWAGPVCPCWLGSAGGHATAGEAGPSGRARGAAPAQATTAQQPGRSKCRDQVVAKDHSAGCRRSGCCWERATRRSGYLTPGSAYPRLMNMGTRSPATRPVLQRARDALPAACERIVAAFERHLRSERGLSPHTVRAYVGDVVSLLAHLHGIDLAAPPKPRAAPEGSPPHDGSQPEDPGDVEAVSDDAGIEGLDVRE